MENREITPPEVGDIFIRFPVLNGLQPSQGYPSIYLVFNTTNQISFLNLQITICIQEDQSATNLEKIGYLDIFKNHEFPFFYGGKIQGNLMYVYTGEIPLSPSITPKRKIQISQIKDDVFFNLIRRGKIKKDEGAIFFGSEKISFEEFENLSKKKLMYRIDDTYPLSRLIRPLNSKESFNEAIKTMKAIQANGIDKTLFNLGFVPMILNKPPTGLQ